MFSNQRRSMNRLVGSIRLFRRLLAALALASALAVEGQYNSIVTVSTFWSQSGAKPGGEINLAVVLDIREPYHINANTAKPPFIPTQVEIIAAPAELRSSTPMFPAPHTIEFGVGDAKDKIPVFTQRAVVFIPMFVTDLARRDEVLLKFKISYQACDDRRCLFPTAAEHEVRLQLVGPNAEVKSLHQEIFSALKDYQNKVNVSFFGWDFAFSASNLWLLLFIAGLGGLLLNFTPCVLPLIPIKIIGLSRAAGNRSRCLLLGSVMSLGIVAFWLVLATAITTISGFNATNKLFQYPAFTITVGILICVMAVGMCGLFAVNVPAWAYRVNVSQETLVGSFLFGIMAAVLSTPCTAPFMGAAAAWATTQKAVITLTTFGAIGVGMALPYLILSAFPVLVRRMPKTGPASTLIKQTMGLLLLAAGAYFLGTGLAGLLATPPDPPTQAYWWAVASFIAAAGGWLAWRTIQITSNAARRVVFSGLGIFLIAIAMMMGVRFTRSSPVHWIYYTPERFAAALAQKYRGARIHRCLVPELPRPGASRVAQSARRGSPQFFRNGSDESGYYGQKPGR